MISLLALLLLAQAAAAARGRPLRRPPRRRRARWSCWRRAWAHPDRARPGQGARSPSTNFLKYVRAGHYDGTLFHRVIPGFMVQGGGMDADDEGEAHRARPSATRRRTALRNTAGHRRHGPHQRPQQRHRAVLHQREGQRRPSTSASGGAGYAVFGEVIEGMDVVDQIVAVPTKTAGPARERARDAGADQERPRRGRRR